MVQSILGGFASALTPETLVLILGGTVLGLAVGAIPGLSSAIGLAIVLPFTFVLAPEPAMLTMVAIYMAAQYGGSITAIVIGVPGTPPAVATTFDGHPMARRGEAGRALGISIVSSAAGGVFGVLILMLAFGPIARFALAFGPAEYFALGIFGLAVVANMVGESVTKGLVSVVIGLLLFVVGLDVMSGYPRLTLGTTQLLDGIHIVPALIGFFAVAEVLRLVGETRPARRERERISGKLVSLAELRSLVPTIFRGSVIGSVVGAIPGAGATIASLIAWNEEQRFAGKNARFGTGVPAGVSAPEAANNSSVGAAMIPLLSLGIPGSASTAILLGGFMLHGINPGPLLLIEHSGLVYAIYAGFIVAALFMLAIGLLGIPLWVRVISLPTAVLAPLILGVSMVGAFALNQRVFDIWLTLFMGVLGYVLLKLRIPLVPAILGLVLGFMVEANYRRALAISGGDHMVFVTNPISLVLLLLAALSFAAPLVRRHIVGPAGSATGMDPQTTEAP